MKKVFLICSVRNAPPEYLRRQEGYVTILESEGARVHYPPRDTDQSACGLDICRQNAQAICEADEVHVFYRAESQGTHFDLGVAFALGKPLVVVGNEEYGPGKSYARMIEEWQRAGGLG